MQKLLSSIKDLRALAWYSSNIIVLVLSCILLVFLFPETVYRDGYLKQKRNHFGAATVTEEGHKTASNDATSLVDRIEAALQEQSTKTINACSQVCEALFSDERNRKICQDRMGRVRSRLEPPGASISSNLVIKELEECRGDGVTDNGLYKKYLQSKEIGSKEQFTNYLTDAQLFIFIFVCLGAAASAIGNLVTDSLIKRRGGQGGGGRPMIGLLLGPVVSCLVAAILVYVFSPGGEEKQYFAKKILDIPVAVYISSFVLSVSPVSTVENIASFISMQIRSIVGEGNKKEDSTH